MTEIWLKFTLKRATKKSFLSLNEQTKDKDVHMTQRAMGPEDTK